MKRVAQEYREVPVDSLTPHPENSNVGDLDQIRSSVRRTGFYGTIAVQKSTSRIIAGEHRWRVAAEEGADTVPVMILDVDDDEARRIMTVDNRSARLGYDDEKRLLAVLETFEGDLEGTGYDEDAFRTLLMSTDALGDQEAAFLAGLSDGERSVMHGSGEPGVVGVGDTELRLPMTTEDRNMVIRVLREQQKLLDTPTLAATLLEVLRRCPATES